MSLKPEAWRLRARTARAMLELWRARRLVARVPFAYWRGRFGLAGPPPQGERLREARRLARHVERAAGRLPGASKCLPQAMALSTLLRRAGTPHALVFAARPAAHAADGDRLHAWVETAGERLIGDLPGPWNEAYRLVAEPGPGRRANHGHG